MILLKKQLESIKEKASSIKSKLKDLFEFIARRKYIVLKYISISLILLLIPLYGYLVYDDKYYIWNKDPQRFAIDGESLDLSSQFKEINLFLDTEIDYSVFPNHF